MLSERQMAELGKVAKRIDDPEIAFGFCCLLQEVRELHARVKELEGNDAE